MKTIFIAACFFAAASALAGQWTYNDASGQLIHSDSAWVLDASAAGTNLTVTGYAWESMSAVLPLDDAVAGGYRIAAIGANAFRSCEGLAATTLPEGVTDIGNGAFYGCGGLKRVTLPASVTSISDETFARCVNLTSVALPDGVTSIGRETFSGCSALTTVAIPDGVASIGAWAFADCLLLTKVTVGSGVVSIGDYAFQGCYDLTLVFFKGTCPVFAGDSVFERTERAVICVRSRHAADWEKNIESGSIEPETAVWQGRPVRIGGWTHDDAGLLTHRATGWTLNVSAAGTNLTVTGVAAKPNGPMVLPLDDETDRFRVAAIGKGAFQGIKNMTGATIPGSVTVIGESAFEDCNGMMFLTLSDGVTSIGRHAFNGCASLTGVALPEGMEVIGDSAFFGCGSLRDVTIPDSVKTIEDSAFRDCARLAAVSIPPSVAHIGISAFAGYTSLTGVAVDEANAAYRDIDGVLLSKDGTLLLAYPAGKAETYEIPSSVTRFGMGAFAGCAGLTGVVIPAGVTGIGNGVFFGCGLTDIAVDGANTAFRSVDGVLFSRDGTRLVLYPEGRAGAYDIPANVTVIGSNAFAGCANLTGVTILDGVTRIENGTFSYCSGLTEMAIPGSVASVGTAAFFRCEGLKDVTLGEGVASIGDSAFARCNALVEVVLPKSVTSIGKKAFPDSTRVLRLGGKEAEE